jgi:hypothetical protein
MNQLKPVRPSYSRKKRTTGIGNERKLTQNLPAIGKKCESLSHRIRQVARNRRWAMKGDKEKGQPPTSFQAAQRLARLVQGR